LRYSTENASQEIVLKLRDAAIQSLRLHERSSKVLHFQLMSSPLSSNHEQISDPFDVILIFTTDDELPPFQRKQRNVLDSENLPKILKVQPPHGNVELLLRLSAVSGNLP
jgi:hypothetical protein